MHLLVKTNPLNGLNYLQKPVVKVSSNHLLSWDYLHWYHGWCLNFKLNLASSLFQVPSSICYIGMRIMCCKCRRFPVTCQEMQKPNIQQKLTAFIEEVLEFFKTRSRVNLCLVKDCHLGAEASDPLFKLWVSVRFRKHL